MSLNLKLYIYGNTGFLYVVPICPPFLDVRCGLLSAVAFCPLTQLSASRRNECLRREIEKLYTLKINLESVYYVQNIFVGNAVK